MELMISPKGLKILENTINKTIVSITADDWRKYNRSYGNIMIKLIDEVIVIENDYKEIAYFGGTDEMAGYELIILDTEKHFESSVFERDLYTAKIDEVVKSVKIVRDEILTIETDQTETKYIIDQAIIFEFMDFQWLICRDSLFMPMSRMKFKEDAWPFLKTLDEVYHEWKDDPEVGEKPAYQVQISREIIDLQTADITIEQYHR